MALKQIAHKLWPAHHEARSDVSNSIVLDASTDRAMIVCTVPKTGTVTHIVWAPRVVTTSQPIDARIEGVTAAGDNDGVALATATQASHTAGTSVETALDVNLAVTAGELRCVVFQFTSTVGNLSILCLVNAGLAVPYQISNTTGSNVRSQANTPLVAFKYSDGSYAALSPVPPMNSVAVTVAYNSSSNPAERGNRLTIPRDCRAAGVWFRASSGSNNSADLILYDAGGTQLRSATLDGDAVGSIGSLSLTYVYFSSPIDLYEGASYRLALKPLSTSNWTLMELTFHAGTMSLLDGGDGVYRTTRPAAGSWTDTATARSWMGLILDMVDDGKPNPRTRPLRSPLI